MNERAYAPHCDASVLHSPGTCRYCDESPDWQAYRMVAHINFSNENDPHRAPCPSDFFRTPRDRDHWYGNVAQP
jgi:hypothetical protein